MTDVQTRPGAALPTAAQADLAAEAGAEQGHGCGGRSRRALLAGAGALGATCVLAACGTDTSSNSTNPNGSDFNTKPAPAGSKGADAGGAGDPGSSGGGATLALAADVPEGGGVIKGDWVITQPTSGTFKAFSKVCTHQGCDVNKIDGGVIRCPCHGSTFSIEDGSPQSGPATKPLEEKAVKADGKRVVAV